MAKKKVLDIAPWTFHQVNTLFMLRAFLGYTRAQRSEYLVRFVFHNTVFNSIVSSCFLFSYSYIMYCFLNIIVH